ncbi:unnamed protein product [Sphagnum tenellum]
MKNCDHSAEVERSNNKSTIREERQSSRGGSEGRKHVRKRGKKKKMGTARHCDPRFLPGEVQDRTLPVISPGTQRYVSHAPPVISPSRKDEMGKRD